MGLWIDRRLLRSVLGSRWTTRPPMRRMPFTAKKHDFRYFSSPPTPSTGDTTKSTTNATNRELFTKLTTLARPEWRYIGMGISTLSLTSSVTLLLPYSAGQIIDYTITTGSDGISPIILSSGLLMLTAVSATGVYWRSVWLSRAGNRIVARLKQRLAHSILHQELGFFHNTKNDNLLSILSNDTSLVQATLTTHTVAALRGSIMSIGSFSMLLWTSPTLAAISSLTLPPIFVLTRYFGRQLREQQTIIQKELGESMRLAEQAIRNIQTVQECTAEFYEHRSYANATAKAHAAALDTARAQALLEATAFCSANAAILGVLGYGATLVLEGTLTAGDLGGFVLYSFLMAGSISGLSSLYGDIVRSLAAANRIFNVLDRQPLIGTKGVDSLVGLDPLQQVNVVSDDPPSSIGQGSSPVLVEFENVNFSYPSRPDTPILQDFTLTLQPGEVVALVGGSGSGKSTVASLLTRQYDVVDRIRLGGCSIRDCDLHSLRRMIGVVSQQPALFDGTIYDNISYGSWDAFSSTDEARKAVMEAAEMAHVMEFASGLPDGIDTLVGTNGSQLSGGQRQRVALARIILKESSLLIFDEATSSLDAKSEASIHSAMEQMIRGRTVLSIAHRLSTIRMASRIVVMQDGRIVQTGSFSELAGTQGPFFELMKTQLQQDGQDDQLVQGGCFTLRDQSVFCSSSKY